MWLLERRGGEPVVVLDVIDLRKGRSEGGREGEELIIIGTIRKAKFHQGNTFSTRQETTMIIHHKYYLYYNILGQLNFP